MKKKHIMLCAVVLSMTLFSGCGITIQTDNTSTVTNETTQEVAETPYIELTPEITEAATTSEVNNTIIEDEEETTTAESYNETTTSTTEIEIKEDENVENTDTDVDSYTTLATLMTAIYEVGNSSTSAETVAEELKTYSFTYGGPSTSSEFEAMANDWFDYMKDIEGKDIRSEFSKSFTTVTSTAQQMDAELEFDLAYLNVINGITAAIG